MSNVVGPIFISVDDQNRSNDIQRNIDAEVMIYYHLANVFSRNYIILFLTILGVYFVKQVVRLLKEAYERVKCLLKKVPIYNYVCSLPLKIS